MVKKTKENAEVELEQPANPIAYQEVMESVPQDIAIEEHHAAGQPFQNRPESPNSSNDMSYGSVPEVADERYAGV